MGAGVANIMQFQFIEVNTGLFSNLSADGVFGLFAFIYKSSRITPTGIGPQNMI